MQKAFVYIAIMLGIGGFISPSFAWAASTGFTQEMVSIEDTTVLEGEITQLSIGFLNEEDSTLTGRVSFYDDDELLGSRDLSLDSKEAETFTIDWEASFGQHSFVAKAENLKLSGSSVTILGPTTTPREIVIGFKNSSVAQNLRDKGGFSAVVAGVVDELYNVVRPFAQRLDVWRRGQVPNLENTQRRIDRDKEEAEGKIKPILIMHGLILSLCIFILSHQIIFFTIVSVVIVLVVRKLFMLIRRIFRKRYDEE